MTRFDSEVAGWTIGVCTLFICILLGFTVMMFYITEIQRSDDNTRDEYPRCHETQSLKGMGDFRDGLWDYYLCDGE